MSGLPAQALATHLINQTLSSLSVLETLNIISRDDASQIRSKLPNPYGPFPSLGAASSPSANASFGQLSLGPASSPPHQPSLQPPIPPMHNQMAVVPSIPPRAAQREVRARALWDYAGTEPDDLQFRSGDTIIVDEEVNDQWFRGRVIPVGQHVPQDRAGLFPSNYIEKENNGKPFSAPQQQPMVPYQSHYQGPPQHHMTVQQPYAQQNQVGMPEPKKENRFGKVGSKLGDSAVHGLGFGAGASIASNIVNKIF